jgi:hypothetical protein
MAGDPGSWNRYAYVGGDPVNRKDPKGLCSQDIDYNWWDDDEVPEGDFSGVMYPGNCTDSPVWVSWANSMAPGSVSLNGSPYYPDGGGDGGSGGSTDDDSPPVGTPILWKRPTKPTKPKCPQNIQNFFNIMIPIAAKLADSLNTSTNDILALSALESGWLDPHNQALHNPFGLTHAGGNNINFSSGYQGAANYWSKNDGSYINGVTDISQFASDLQPHYNTVNPLWASTVVDLYGSVLKWRAICGE